MIGHLGKLIYSHTINNNKKNKTMNREIKFRAWDGSDKYVAGDDGKIYSTDFNNTGKTKVLKGYKDKDGYHRVLMNIKGKRKCSTVHKLVALAFIGEKPSLKHQINHINGIRDDNRPENLEYVTVQQNVIHSWRVLGRKHSKEHNESMSKRFIGVNNHKAKINEYTVLSIRRLRSKGDSLKSIAERYGISTSQISAIANNKYWKCV